MRRVVTNFIKSKTDKRLYKCIQLNNSLRCILVSDPDTEQSAASLNVHVGSLYDPLEYQGLAHFCEHMLFLGTKKYPNENDYADYIISNGGSNNASTSAMDTNFHFCVGNKALNGALDRFSQFFKDPLFNPDSVEREINAVDSEHKKNLQNDSRRLNQVIKSQANPLSSLNRFTTGSSETLNKRGIRDRLLEFHDKYYSANLMTLGIIGKHSLDYLEELATEHFSDIKNKQVTPLNFNEPIPYDSTRLGKLYKFVPINSRHTLKMSWLFPDTRMLYKSKPLSYATFLIGHEGVNSLLSYLLDEELALSLISSVSNKEANTSFLNATIELTEKGLKSYERVIEIVSAYINFIRDKEPQQYLFHENSLMSKLSFDYKNQTNAFDYIVDLTYSLQDYKGENVSDILTGPYTIEHFDSSLISSLMKERLRADNMLVVLSSKTCAEEANQEEKWYKSKYSIQDLPQNTIKKLNNIKVSSSKSGKVLDLPLPNTLIPKNIKLLNVPASPLIVPRQIKENMNGAVWHKQDHKFKVPKAYGFCQVYTNHRNIPKSSDASLAWKFRVMLFFEEMREFLYETQLAGIDCDLGFAGRLDMRFYGFNDSLPQVFDQFLTKFRTFRPEQYQKLYNLKQQQNIRRLKSFLTTTPYIIGLTDWKNGISEYGQNSFDRLKTLTEFSFDRFIEFSKEWLSTTRFEWFISGNISDSLALSITEKAEELLKGEPLPEDRLEWNRVVQIPPSTEYTFTQYLPNGNEVNSCIVSYFQYEPYLDKDIYKWCLNELLFEALKEPAFDTLRTKEQLGYIVDCSSYNLNKVLGGKFLIQSSKASPEALRLRINKFLESMRTKIKSISEKEFKNYVESVSIPLRQIPISLLEESAFYWVEIENHEYLFNRDNKKLEALAKIKKEDLINYFEKMFFMSPRRYEYHLVCNNHIKENESIKKMNGKERIEVTSEIQMRQLNSLYPNIYLLNKRANIG